MENNKNLLNWYHSVNNYGKANELSFKLISPGHVEYTMKIKEQHLALPSAAHGGAIAGLMDGLLGVAALSAVYEEGKIVSTIEFNIKFLLPVEKGEQLKGIGKVLKKGNKILFTIGEIFNSSNQLVALGSGSFNSYLPK